MVDFIEQKMAGIAVAESDFFKGKWISIIKDLLALPRVHRQGTNGAEQIGKFILSI
jgi:hypothetical protein